MNYTTTLDPNLGREDRLLSYCIQAFLDERDYSKMNKLLNDGIDWSNLIDAAENHRVLPLIYLSLHNNCPELIPEDVAFCLQDRLKKISLTNLAMTKELLQLLDEFSSAEIASIPFKGPITAIDIYGDLTRRQYGDLDLLIHLKDLHKASALLEGIGYEPEYRMNKSQFSAFLKSDHHQRFINPDRGIMIELHWNLYPSIYKIPVIDMDDLWKRAETEIIFGKKILTFSKEDLLLYLCIHGAKHGWERLSWICDLAMLIKNKQVDWQDVLRKANDAGCKRLLLLGLFLESELLSVPIAAEIIDAIENDPAIPSLAIAAMSNLSSRENEVKLSNKLFYLKATDRLQDKANIYIRDKVRPHIADYEFIRLPNSLYPLYFIIRPVRLIYEHISRQ